MKNDDVISKLSNDLSVVREERESVYSEYLKLQDKIHKLRRKEEKLQEKVDRLKLGAMGSKINWNFLLDDAHHKSRVVYDRMQRELNKIGLYADGVVNETGQSCVQIKAIVGEADAEQKNKTCKAGLRSILKYLKADKNDEVYVDILESTLSIDGIYYLIMKKEGNAWVGQIRRRRYNTVSNKTDWLPWKDIFPEMQRICPYGSSCDDDEDDW